MAATPIHGLFPNWSARRISSGTRRSRTLPDW